VTWGDAHVIAWSETMGLIAVNPRVCNPNLVYVDQMLNSPVRDREGLIPVWVRRRTVLRCDSGPVAQVTFSRWRMRM
jgi:hypothetical protein